MYYQGNSEIQSDGVQTLYLMNPNYDSMVMMNSHAPPPPFVGVPLSHDLRPLQGIEAAITPRFQYNTWAAAAPDQTQRGLSLSLSARQADFPAPPTMRSVLIGSKYLKAAQELLDEVANVGRVRNVDRPPPSKVVADNIHRDEGKIGNQIGCGDILTTPQRQEIQMKKAKLNSMLDEVEQRHRQYEKQMQMVVGAFEQAAGSGSARIYTQLALKTILKQFKCLKSTIYAQIKGLNRSLGEEEEEESVGRKLKVVDYELRQQQQLGMMHTNAWKPQRGLPERAVSVLRAWLFEHFLHPYPKDSDKQMLAKQTGLTRSQVSNWFINARVRLWKPMVEEMYQEETKTHQQINSEKDTSTNKKPPSKYSIPRTNTNTPTTDPPPTAVSEPSFQSPTGFSQLIITSFDIENHLKKPRNGSMQDRERNIEFNTIKFSPHPAQITTENYLSMAAAATDINRYGIGELNADHQLAAAGNFQGNGFSLTLGLPPAETLSRRNFEFGSTRGVVESDRINQAGASHPSIAYEILDFQNRKPHPAHLLPDFVA